MSNPIPSQSPQNSGSLEDRLAKSSVSAATTASAAEAAGALMGGYGSGSNEPVSPVAPSGYSAGSNPPAQHSSAPAAPAQHGQALAPGGYSYQASYGAPAGAPQGQPGGGYGDPGASQSYGAAPGAGAQQYPSHSYAAASAGKSKVAAGLLAIFLGGLGIHNFYLGRTVRGVIQLLISVISLGSLAWVSYIWAFIEGVLILTAQSGNRPWGVDAHGVPLRS